MRRLGVVPVAAAFALLPLLAGASPAAAMPVATEGPGGFATTATATPVKLDIFEPAIPIPAEPQAELNAFYTRVEASSGPTGHARASALWPGDPVGEGFKTIGDTAGLPPQLTENGYPVQVNAHTPGDTSSASQEPLPGIVTRVSADEEASVAQAGLATAGEVADDPAAEEDGGDPPEASVPGLPGLDTLLSGDLAGGLAGLADLQPSSSERTPTRDGARAASAAPANPLGGLAAVVDARGVSSVSRTTYADATVTASATSALGDVRLLGGLIRLRSVVTEARSTSDLGGATSTATTRYAGATVAGQPFEITADGVVAAGRTQQLPGLPDDPAKALEALGISITLPEPTVTRDGVHSSVDSRGIKVVVDTSILRSKLPSLPMGELVGGLPEEAKQLKGLLLALNEAAPRVVLHLGTARTEALSVPPISFGSLPDSATGNASTGGQGATAGTTGAAGATGAGSVGTGAPPAGGTTAAAPAGDPIALQNVSATPGLPPLGTVPGMLTLGGLALAGAAGWWMRRAGLLVLGGAASCSHGLASGIPDLRKAAP